MTYFSNFPSIYYDGEKTGTPSIVTDVIRRVAINANIKSNGSFYYEYTVKDGETAENLAHRLYDNAGYHWIVLLANEIENPYFDWALDSASFDRMIADKYPGSAIYGALSTPGVFPMTKGDAITNAAGALGNFMSWNASLKCLTATTNRLFNTSLITHTLSGQTFAVSRVVEYSRYGLHSFTDTNGKNLDPYRAAPVWNSTLQTYVQPALGTGTSLLNSYVAGASSIANVTIVTNNDYETSLNEAKRKIKLVRPEYVQSIVSEMEKVFSV